MNPELWHDGRDRYAPASFDDDQQIVCSLRARRFRSVSGSVEEVHEYLFQAFVHRLGNEFRKRYDKHLTQAA